MLDCVPLPHHSLHPLSKKIQEVRGYLRHSAQNSNFQARAYFWAPKILNVSRYFIRLKLNLAVQKSTKRRVKPSEIATMPLSVGPSLQPGKTTHVSCVLALRVNNYLKWILCFKNILLFFDIFKSFLVFISLIRFLVRYPSIHSDQFPRQIVPEKVTGGPSFFGCQRQITGRQSKKTTDTKESMPHYSHW